jgi:uncharacterized protein with HEPN domain
MLFDSPRAALLDIGHHIELATQFVTGMGYAEFRDDPRTVYPVTRCLEIISEASRRLPDELKARHPSIAWKNMAGAGNVYRHDYEDVTAKLVWETVQLALPPLRDVIARNWLRRSKPVSDRQRQDGNRLIHRPTNRTATACRVRNRRRSFRRPPEEAIDAKGTRLVPLNS